MQEKKQETFAYACIYCCGAENERFPYCDPKRFVLPNDSNLPRLYFIFFAKYNKKTCFSPNIYKTYCIIEKTVLY